MLQRLNNYIASFRFVPEVASRPHKLVVVGWAILLVAVLIYGFSLRLFNQSDKELWTDEVWRAQQILHASSYQELSDGHYFGQEAPVQYSEFILGKIGLGIFGVSEMAFRIWPILFSLTSLVLMTYVAVKLFSPLWSVLAVFLFASSIGYVEHAYEFKPYAYEIMLSTACFALGVYIDSSRRMLLSWVFLGLFLILVLGTNIAPFYLFLPILALYRKDLRHLWPYLFGLGVVCVLCALIGGFYYSNYLEQLKENSIFAFWKGFYLDSPEKVEVLFTGTLPRTLWIYLFSYSYVLRDSWEVSAALGAIVFVVSPVLMLIRSHLLALFVIIPALTQIILAVLGLYPFLSRVGAFYYPFIVLSLCYFGNCLTSVRIGKAGSILSLVCLLACGYLFNSYVEHVPIARHFGTNRHIEDIGPFVNRLRNEARHEDLLLPGYSARMSLRFYAPELESKMKVITHPDDRSVDTKRAKDFIEDIIRKHPGSRAWLISTFKVGGFEHFLRAAKELGAELSFVEKRQGAYLMVMEFPQAKAPDFEVSPQKSQS